MGKIELDHTGSGSGITLSSDGTNLLLGGTAIGGGGGGDPDLFDENYDGSTTAPNATGTNAFAIGVQSTSSATNSVAIGTGAYVTHQGGIGLGYSPTVTANYGAAIGANSAGAGAKVSGAGGVALGGSNTQGSEAFSAVIDNTTTSYGASGANSIAMGYQAKATNSYATVSGGASNVASGYHSTVIGGSNNLADNIGSTVLGGRYGTTRGIRGATIFAGYGNQITATQGTTQSGLYILAEQTTDATATALKTDNQSSSSTANQIVLPNNSCYGFTGTVIARENSAQTNDFAVWEIKGGAVRAGSASTTALGSYNINKISESTGAANWSIALSEDTTNGAVAITVTGEASHSIRWVATVNTTEVTY